MSLRPPCGAQLVLVVPPCLCTSRLTSIFPSRWPNHWTSSSSIRCKDSCLANTDQPAPTVVKGQIIYTYVYVYIYVYIHVHIYLHTHICIYAWVHVCIHLYLYLYLYLQVVPLLCLNPDISWMGCFWDCFLQASISLSLPLALTFSLAFLTFANSTSVAKSHGQAIYDEHDNNNIQLQPLFPACLFAKPYANIFSHIILFNPYNPMQAGLFKYLFYK